MVTDVARPNQKMYMSCKKITKQINHIIYNNNMVISDQKSSNYDTHTSNSIMT